MTSAQRQRTPPRILFLAFIYSTKHCSSYNSLHETWYITKSIFLKGLKSVVYKMGIIIRQIFQRKTTNDYMIISNHLNVKNINWYFCFIVYSYFLSQQVQFVRNVMTMKPLLLNHFAFNSTGKRDVEKKNQISIVFLAFNNEVHQEILPFDRPLAYNRGWSFFWENTTECLLS